MSSTASALPPGHGGAARLAPVLPAGLHRFIFWTSLVAGWLWTLYLLRHSPGTFTHDEIGHFVIARDAWHSPSLILNAWGRAANTLVYMIPALFGLTGARVAATLMSAMTVVFASLLARKLGAEYYFAVPIVVWFQFWYCDFSHAAITEIPFSLVMVLCAYFFVSGEFLAVSIAAGLLPYLRTEGIVFMLLWAVYCLCRKKWGASIITFLPFASYNVLVYFVYGAGQLQTYANTHPIGKLQMQLFGVGRWSYYPRVLLDHVGLAIMVLAIYALSAILQRSARLLVFAFYGIYMGIHMVLYHYGLYGAGGDIRYVFPLAPAIGVAAAFGLEHVAAVLHAASANLFSGSHQEWLTPAAVTVMLSLVFAVGVRYTVHPLDPEAVEARMTADWLRHEELTGHLILSTHVYFYYYLPLRVPSALWQNPNFASAEPGTIAIWDSHYSEIFGLPRAALSPANGWELLREFDYPPTGDTVDLDAHPPARFLVFEKREPQST
jgi:hypothetical protein